MDDFSENNPPSHPKTLDFVADEFVASGYDFRGLLRDGCRGSIDAARTIANCGFPEDLELSDDGGETWKHWSEFPAVTRFPHLDSPRNPYR